MGFPHILLHPKPYKLFQISKQLPPNCHDCPPIRGCNDLQIEPTSSIMKRLILISSLVGASLVAACGGGDQDVSRNQIGLLSLLQPEGVEAGAFSARSSLDLLSFN